MGSLIESVVADHGLALNGLTVLTECASGPFQVTPLLALASGAERVIALGVDSHYGKFKENSKQIISLARNLHYEGDLEFISSYEKCAPSEIDILTNLRMLRPIPDEFIQDMKSTSAIALMFEPWEYRQADFNIESARRNEITVIGTNEANPLVDTLRYVGLLALKLLLENNVTILHSKIWIIGDDIFGKACLETLERLGAKVEVTNMQTSKGLLSPIQKPDAVIVIENKNPNALFFHPKTTAGEYWMTPNMKVIHICGNLSLEIFETHGIELIPNKPAAFGYMSFNTSHLGYEPVARLHSGGLKAAEIVVRARISGNSITQSINQAITSGFGLGFN
jgi:hypothetical protein